MPEYECLRMKLTKSKLNYVVLGDKYSNIKVPHTERKIISDSSKRDGILLKRDKGQGGVVMDRSKYTAKCLEML